MYLYMIKFADKSLILNVYIQPQSRFDNIVGIHHNEIKINLTALPVDNKANKHLIHFLSKKCKVAKSHIMIEKGQLSRHKQVRIVEPKVIPVEIKQILADRNKL
ncbi:YggU family protein [Candidatus Hamiltonella defensa]|uniref:UPF0235 protein HDEF_2231 n=3 Tax=Candidatus Williamhamiltonella defendens TaxID=138072 RepID=C4K8B8_HAMD5|nr:hypothetical protein HDEF_2231 [Candidatus Hamiltonella defensa 5AT (Acyrthosiphon pisum)]ASV34041.1 YggU family protein [Candidatus Hamiltonella defensa]AWK16998.1 YggU family protein [Candidatus Hamiltonella defensa]AYB49740.1 YggU family protein [Candidatus Hamiltonella defensa]MBK4362103.1 YggU family protein [Candidatus Hamiltonella defensa]